jgi:putative transposase
MNTAQSKVLRMQNSHTHHLLNRGRNRECVFFSELEKLFFLQLCEKHSKEAHCKIHAYCLMANHFHLLITPEVPGALSTMMMNVLGQYAQWFNRMHMRSGSVWGTPFKSIAIDSDNYLLSCMRYIELNPCRAGLVINPEDYVWSSYLVNAFGNESSMIHFHNSYLDLASDFEARLFKYRILCNDSGRY